MSGSGQPRPGAEGTPRRPSAAQRARTLVEGNSSLSLTIPGLNPPEPGGEPLRHWVGPEGDVLLLYPRGAAPVRAVGAADDGEPVAVLEAADVAPVAVAHRIRGRAWFAGWLSLVPGGAVEAGTELLRLEPGEITVDDLWGAGPVEPEDFALAAPDPLAAYETGVLQHLAAAHAQELAALCGLVGGACGPGRARGAVAGAVPLALDSYGLRVRFTGPDGAFDARFDFPEPVDGVPAARRALAALFRAALQQ